MNYKITYPTPLSEIDIENDNIDVCVSTNKGKEFLFVVATIKNVEKLLENGVLNPNTKLLIVDALTQYKIENIIDMVMQDEKICYFYGKD